MSSSDDSGDIIPGSPELPTPNVLNFKSRQNFIVADSSSDESLIEEHIKTDDVHIIEESSGESFIQNSNIESFVEDSFSSIAKNPHEFLPKMTFSTPALDTQSPSGKWRTKSSPVDDDNTTWDKVDASIDISKIKDYSSEEDDIVVAPRKPYARQILDDSDDEFHTQSMNNSKFNVISSSEEDNVESADELKEPQKSEVKSDLYLGKYKIKPKSSSLLSNASLKSNSSCEPEIQNASGDISQVSNSSSSSKSALASKYSIPDIEKQIAIKKNILQKTKLDALPDKGKRVKEQLSELEEALTILSIDSSNNSTADESKHSNFISDVSTDSHASFDSFKDKSGLPEIEILEQPESKIDQLKRELKDKKDLYKTTDPIRLPDRGLKLYTGIKSLEKEILMLEMKEKAGAQFTGPQSRTVMLQPDLVKGSEATKYKQATLEEFGLQKGSLLEAMKPTLSKNVVNSLYGAEKDYGARNYGGKLSTKNEINMVKVTTDAISVIHKALKSMPDVETVEVEQPNGLKVQLLPHQRRALAWLLWREQQNPPGGILADDMGLGKTLTMISLIMKHRQLVENNIIEEFMPSFDEEVQEGATEEHWIKKSKDGQCKTSIITSKGSLVVCPASLLGQWEGEAKRHVHSKEITVMVYHGNNRDLSLKSLAKYDMVITTYQLVMREAFQSAKAKATKKKSDFVPCIGSEHQGKLFQIGWTRIILDEAHQIRNHKSQTAQGVCLLKGGRRWVVTGTPVQNKGMDLYSLIRFLRVEPFDNYTAWKHQVDNNTAQGRTRMNILVKALLLRRTKDQIDQTTGQKLVDLPSKTTVQHSIALSQEERQIYDRIFAFSRSTLKEYMKNQEDKEKELVNKHKYQPNLEKNKDNLTPTLPTNMANIGEVSGTHLLVLLLRLRQICCHPSLIKGMIEDDTKVNDGLDKPPAESADDLISQLNNMSLRPSADEQVDEDVKEKVLTLDNPVFRRKIPSSKIVRVIDELSETREKGTDKSVIVSQWTSMLEVMYKHLKKAGFKCSAITGQVPVKERADIVDSFNNDSGGPQILLLSLGAGGVGLNLVGANHLFLLDMHWNPQLEAQASDRIYRVGQKKPVTIHRFVVENTVEERILDLQKKKMELAESVLTGAKQTVANKLTFNDIKLLFNVQD